MNDYTSQSFQSMLSMTEHLGPFHPNPKIDEAYRTLRIMGASEIEAKKMINNEINRRLNERLQ